MIIKSPLLNKSAAGIAASIVDSYNKSLGVFQNKVNAEDLVPDTTIENQIQFLFWTLQMDYATKSSRLYANTNTLFIEEPGWIETDYFNGKTESELLKIIKEKMKPRYANEIAKRFKINAELLDNKHEGSAMNIVNESKDAADLLKRIREFRGFGPKLGSFLTRTFVGLLDLKYEDLENILPPVDIHDVRLTHKWGLNESKEISDSNIKHVQQLWSEACKEANVSWVTFDKALWLIGSEGVRTDDVKKDFCVNCGLKTN